MYILERVEYLHCYDSKGWYAFFFFFGYMHNDLRLSHWFSIADIAHLEIFQKIALRVIHHLFSVEMLELYWC
jgi:hypothetical protein